MPRLFLVVLALLAVPHAFGQGFNTFSGRNHPELDWQVAETEHFRIVYPERLAGIEAEAAAIAEATYEALSANLGVTFDRKPRIYLSDEDEVSNGFAVPIGEGYTAIWVHLNSAATVWTGREKWLRKVIAHELAHIFHYQAVRGSLGLLDNVFGEPLPRFWTEGLAQYETETWDAQRGGRYLRPAVLDDQLSYEDGRSIYNGRLLYAVGNSQVRYFAEQYGDTTLAQLLEHRAPKLFGLAEVHDFEAAFNATTDESYRHFYDDWRRHVNVYYNVLAAQLEPLDSLHAEPLGLPGEVRYDVQAAPNDTSRLAVLALTSRARPVRRLYLAERDTAGRVVEAEVLADGGIQTPVAWSPDGTEIVYSRQTRGRYGSIVYDLYRVETGGDGPERLTYGRRATHPTFAPGGRRLAFVGSEGGTGNVFVLDLRTGEETQVTSFVGNVQLGHLRWHPSADTLAFAIFYQDGTRRLLLLDLATGNLTPITSGEHDDRNPVWSPDGTALAYTSLRDLVPNAFVYDLATETHRRVTHLTLGATPLGWLPPDSARASGRLLLHVQRTKGQDAVYPVDATRAAPVLDPEVPPEYAGWTTHRPPREVPVAPEPDAALIRERYAYDALANLTHATSLAFPYYAEADDWGVAGGTVWLEPLGKHLVAGFASLSVPAPWEEGFYYLGYVNNQLRPTLGLALSRLPGTARAYGRGVLVERVTGVDLMASLPLDWLDRPYEATTLDATLTLADLEPLDADDLDLGPSLPTPERGQQSSLTLGLTVREQRPFRLNRIHPLDGLGLRLEATGATPLLGTDTRFLRGDAAAYAVLPSLVGLHRFYLYGRAQAQTGGALAQDVLGLSRYDAVQLPVFNNLPLQLGDADRVRGYRRYNVGDRILFGTLEYRVPITYNLRTRLLGLLRLGGAALALFADGGVVWNEGERVAEQLGTGAEIKTEVQVLGFPLGGAVGVAQPASRLGTDEDWEVYARIRTALAF